MVHTPSLKKNNVMSYCSAIDQMQPGDRKSLHKNYHDHHYGFPIHDDNELFGRLILDGVELGDDFEKGEDVSQGLPQVQHQESGRLFGRGSQVTFGRRGNYT